MPPKSKVSQSPNYNQILDWIDEGKSSRWISRELKNQFDESIGHVAISNFRKKNIANEALEIVDTQLKKESKEKELEEKDKESKKQEVIKNKAKQVEQQHQGDIKVQGLAEATAKQYRGVLNVAKNFEEDYYAMKKALHNEESKINERDVVEVSFKAVKLIHDISKDDASVEDSITNGFEELSNAIKKSREIHKQS